MKVVFSAGVIFAVCQVGALAQYSGSGGGSGSQSPASFTASKIGASAPLLDRLLALTVPGASLFPARFSGSAPIDKSDTISIAASTWNVGLEVYDPISPSTVLFTSTGDVFSGVGETGSWNGSDDPGATILPSGNTAGGYGQFAAQIVLDVGMPEHYAHWSSTGYQYKGTHIFYYGIPGDPSVQASTPVPWFSGILYRTSH